MRRDQIRDEQEWCKYPKITETRLKWYGSVMRIKTNIPRQKDNTETAHKRIDEHKDVVIIVDNIGRCSSTDPLISWSWV